MASPSPSRGPSILGAGTTQVTSSPPQNVPITQPAPSSAISTPTPTPSPVVVAVPVQLQQQSVTARQRVTPTPTATAILGGGQASAVIAAKQTRPYNVAECNVLTRTPLLYHFDN
jgi:hypothetical protein